MPSPDPLAYALLIGQGRSGTNYLLSLLDQSAATHCRNEPDQLDSSALSRLAEFRFFVGDEPRLREALASLDLLVCVDLYRNVTGELAHYLLPATDQFEREDLTYAGLGLQVRPGW